MNQLDDRGLEAAIRTALQERAVTISPTMDGSRAISKLRRPRALVAAFAATSLVAVALGLAIWIDRDATPRSRISSGRIVDGRVEVVLHEEPITNELRRALTATQPGVPEQLRTRFDFGTDPHPLALRADKSQLLLVVSRSPIKPTPKTADAPRIRACLTLATRYAGGPSSSCGQEFGAPEPQAGLPKYAVDQLLDERHHTEYIAWIDVPADAARVTYDSKLTHEWQVPVRGVALFGVAVDQNATLRAYSAAGRLVGEQSVEAPEFPSEGYISTWPAWYDLDATLRFCSEGPIMQVDAFVGGHLGKYSAFDHGTGGIVDWTSREACRSFAPLRPEPGGEINGTLTVVNGAFHIDYHRLIDPRLPNLPAKQRPITEADARSQIASRRAAIAPVCAENSKASKTVPGCQIGG